MATSSRRLISIGTSLALVGCSIAATTGVGTSVGSAAEPAAQVFGFTGAAQSYVVPDEVCQVHIDALGAQGGGGTLVSTFTMAAGGHTWYMIPSPGGKGGEAVSTVTVTPGESLQVNVGGAGSNVDPELIGADVGAGGWNGGGNAGSNGVASDSHTSGGGGGGASDVRRGGTGLGERIVVAGGGGGRGNNSTDPIGDGGQGGNPATPGADGSQMSYNPFPQQDGSTGSTTYGTAPGGGGAAVGMTPGAGGAAGMLGEATGEAGEAGSLGSGGAGADRLSEGGGGGGGGGGLMGGGGGGTSIADLPGDIPQYDIWSPIDAGGGGGSSLGDTTTAGARSGDGQVTITPVAGSCEQPTTTTTESVTTAPPATEPVTTAPPATEPATTEPAVTEPAVTEPAVTEPAVTTVPGGTTPPLAPNTSRPNTVTNAAAVAATPLAATATYTG